MKLLQTLIDEAAKVCKSQNQLAVQLGTGSGTVSEWKTGSRHCPDKYVMAMAKIAGRDPIKTALAIYEERLRKTATTALAGVAAILLAWAGMAGDAANAASLTDTARDNV